MKINRLIAHDLYGSMVISFVFCFMDVYFNVFGQKSRCSTEEECKPRENPDLQFFFTQYIQYLVRHLIVRVFMKMGQNLVFYLYEHKIKKG